MKLEHTMGPWQTGKGIDDGGYLGVWGPDDERVICRVSPFDEMDNIDGPNARLIAAAPEMLEALIAVYRYGTYSSTDWSGVLGVIEKATGKTWE